MDYKNKYLKYKNKYLLLKKQIGGMMDGNQLDGEQTAEQTAEQPIDVKKQQSLELLKNMKKPNARPVTNRISIEIKELIDIDFYLDSLETFFNFIISDKDDNKYHIIIPGGYPFARYIIINNIYFEMVTMSMREKLYDFIISYKNDYYSDKKRILIICHPNKINNIQDEHQCFTSHEKPKISSLLEHIPPNSKIVTMDRQGKPDILTDLWSDSLIQNFTGFFDGLFMLDCYTWSSKDESSITIPLKAITHTLQLIRKDGFAIYSTVPTHNVTEKVCEKIETEIKLKYEVFTDKTKTSCSDYKYVKIYK